VTADYEADEYGYSMAVQVENWCQVKERLMYDTLQYLLSYYHKYLFRWYWLLSLMQSTILLLILM